MGKGWLGMQLQRLGQPAFFAHHSMALVVPIPSQQQLAQRADKVSAVLGLGARWQHQALREQSL